MSGVVSHDGSISGDLVFDDGSSNFITLATPSVGADFTLTLPTTAGSADEVLKTNGSGVLSWVAQAGGSSPSVGTVVQATSKTTGVTLDTDVGKIKLSTVGTIAADSNVIFTLTNSVITTSSVIMITANMESAYAVNISAILYGTPSTGSCNIRVQNVDTAAVSAGTTVSVMFQVYNP